MSDSTSQIISMFMSMTMMRSDTLSITTICFTLCILLFTQFTMSIIKTVQDELSTNIGDIWSSYMSKKAKTFKLQANITYKNNVLYERDITNTFKAVMSDIYKKITADKNRSLNYTVQDVCTTCYKSTDSIKMIVFSNRHEYYYPVESVRVQILFTSTPSEKEDYMYDTYSIVLSADDDEYIRILKYLDTCIEQYDEEQSNSLKSQHIFILSNIYTENKKRDIRFDCLPFNTTKTFDSMFFEEKESLKSYINYFMNNESKYRKLGKPYTLGLLLHGYPGTGKTSFIKALARYTARHIVVLSSKKIKNIDSLKDIFLNEEINDIRIPHTKRLYVFEEIDCSQWKNMVSSREKTDIQKNSIYDNSKSCAPPQQHLQVIVQTAVQKALKTEIDEFSGDENKDDTQIDLNLGDFLDLLDGIIEMPGRMIIFTSNHPEILDPALLRPGRIDKVIEFKKMRRENIKDMYKLWFDHDMDTTVYEKLEDYKYSQAEIGHIFEMIESGNVTIESLLH